MVTQNWKRIATRRHGPILRLDDFNHIYLVTLEHGDEAFDAVVKYVPYSTWSRIEQKNALRYSGWIGPHIHSVGHVPGGIEIVMEAAPFTLANYRQIALSTSDEQLFVARTLTDLLDLLERDDLSHNDLKPQNVLVFPSRDCSIELRLTDFSYTLSPSRFSRKVQKSERPLGTFGYIPPEFFDEDFYTSDSPYSSLTIKQDIFSFGMILFYLVCGDLPREELSLPTPQSDESRERHKEIMRSWQYRSAVLKIPILSTPPAFKELVYSCTEPDPLNRPQSFDEIRTLLYSA